MDSGSNVGSSVNATDVPLPAVERRDDVDLDAEGIDVERLVDKIGDDVATTAGDSDGQPGSITLTDGASERETIESKDSVTERGDERSPGDADAPDLDRDTSSLEEIRMRLDRIEDAVTGARATATVIDAGDEVTLLRLFDDSISENLAHGQMVDLVLRDLKEDE